MRNIESVRCVRFKIVVGILALSVIRHGLVHPGKLNVAAADTGADREIPSALASLQTIGQSTENVFKSNGTPQEAPWRDVWMRVTGFCPCRRCCGKFSDGVTASGHRIERGDEFVAADKKHSFGTRIIVPGYNNSKPVRVLDRGRTIHGDRLDVFFNSHREAQEWGVRYLRVKVQVR